nr:hypothetical protein [Tanacetum cinerariifolium]
KAFNDRTVDYDKLERKLNDALGQLAHKDSVIREGLKTKAYELSVVKEKHDELMKHSLLTKSHYEGLVKQKTKQEMHADLKYVKSLKKEINKLEFEKAEFSDMCDVILQECVSKDVMCSYLQSLSDLDALAELQCMYLHKVKECDCLAQRLSKQTKSVSKKGVGKTRGGGGFGLGGKIGKGREVEDGYGDVWGIGRGVGKTRGGGGFGLGGKKGKGREVEDGYGDVWRIGKEYLLDQLFDSLNDPYGF